MGVLGTGRSSYTTAIDDDLPIKPTSENPYVNLLMLLASPLLRSRSLPARLKDSVPPPAELFLQTVRGCREDGGEVNERGCNDNKSVSFAREIYSLALTSHLHSSFSSSSSSSSSSSEKFSRAIIATVGVLGNAPRRGGSDEDVKRAVDVFEE